MRKRKVIQLVIISRKIKEIEQVGMELNLLEMKKKMDSLKRILYSNSNSELILAEGAGLRGGYSTPETLSNRDRCRCSTLLLLIGNVHILIQCSAVKPALFRALHMYIYI